MEELADVMEQLQEASLWFPGGCKEMKESLPLYKDMEKKIELMNECVQVRQTDDEEEEEERAFLS